MKKTATLFSTLALVLTVFLAPSLAQGMGGSHGGGLGQPGNFPGHGGHELEHNLILPHADNVNSGDIDFRRQLVRPPSQSRSNTGEAL